MLEAMYGVEFVSSQSGGGYGVAIFETGRVFGGDSSMVYIGNYQLKGDFLRVDVECTNDHSVLPSVFGNIKQFNLELEGKPARDRFVLTGTMVEDRSMQIAIQFTRRAELP